MYSRSPVADLPITHRGSARTSGAPFNHGGPGMRKFQFRRLGPASIALVAGVTLATAGTGYAAGRYVITSTKQISPKVLRQLHGAHGAAGTPGTPGPQGPQGAPGLQGAAGTARAYGQVVTGAN